MVARVAVIIPAFNAQETIGNALISVQGQTYQDFDIIVCDDCSTDDTLAVVRKFSDKDHRLTVLANEKNMGPSFSRNRAISVASSEWIAMLDADDIFDRDRLRKLVDIGIELGADIVCDNLILCSPRDAQPLGLAIPRSRVSSVRQLSARTLIASDAQAVGPLPPSMSFGYLKPIIRKSFLTKHNIKYVEDIRVGEDFMVLAECLIKGARCFLTPEPLYHYRMWPNSLSRNPGSNPFPNILSLSERLLRMAEATNNQSVSKELVKREKRLRAIINYQGIVDCSKNRKYFEAACALFRSSREWPFYAARLTVRLFRRLAKRLR